MKRILCVFLALLLCLMTAACAKPAEEAPAVSYSEMLAMMKQSAPVNYSEIISYIPWWGSHDGRVWACGWEKDDALTLQSARPTFVSMRPDGSDLKQLTPAITPSEELAARREQLAAEDPDGEYFLSYEFCSLLWNSAGETLPVLCETLFQSAGADEPAQTLAKRYSVCTLDAEGRLQQGAALQLPEELADSGQIVTAAEWLLVGDSALWCFVSAYDETAQSYLNNQCLRFSPADGSLTAALSLPDGHPVADRQLLADGSLLLLCGTGSVCSLRILQDPTGASPQLGEALPLEAGDIFGLVQTLDGGIMAETVAVTTSGLGSYSPDTGEITWLLRWGDYGLDGLTACMRPIFAMGDGQFLLAERDALLLLTVVEQDALAGRAVLTFAMTDSTVTNMEDLVLAYNAAEPEVYIELLDYTSQTAMEKGYSGGTEMLAEDIRNGLYPDIVMLPADSDYMGYIAKGMFTDLYPLLDADPELAREDFLSGILSACEYNGELSYIAPTFGMLTAAGAADVVGDAVDWTWEQYDALAAAHPEATPFYGYGRGDLLHYTLQMGGARFIDYNTGTAHLDTPDFIRLLEASAAYPETGADLWGDPKPALSSGEYLLYPSSIYDAWTVLELEYAFDGPVTLIGFPSDTGDGSVASASMRLAISSTCEKQEAAWQFVRTFLLPQYQDSVQFGFPLRLDSLERMAEAATEPDDAAGIPYYLLGLQLTDDQMAYWQQGLSEEQAARLWERLYALDTLYHFDSTIIDIIWEEADYFYNGVRSAAEAAAIMQDRVQTYLDEKG